MTHFTSASALAFAAVLACSAAAGTSTSQDGATNGAATFTNGNIALAYEIDFPPGSGPFPAVVLAHGSGRTTRDQLRYLSNQWVLRGFAALRFDKRGVGQSTGEYSSLNTPNSLQLIGDLAGDVVAAVRLLRRHPKVDATRVGLSGNSQAGWILPAAARELGDVVFMVILSGPVCTIGEELFYSDLAEWSERPLDDVYRQLLTFKGPHGYDPVADLRVINTPTLWLFGVEDRSIPVRTSIERLQSLAASGKPFEWRTYPSVGHQLPFSIWKDVDPWLERLRR
jgi:hypothetical protein